VRQRTAALARIGIGANVKHTMASRGFWLYQGARMAAYGRSSLRGAAASSRRHRAWRDVAHAAQQTARKGA